MNIDQQFITAAPSAELVYHLTWKDPAPRTKAQVILEATRVKCFSSAGSCVISDLDENAKSATITRTGPAAASDEEIVILVGNQHYFASQKDRVHFE